MERKVEGGQKNESPIASSNASPFGKKDSKLSKKGNQSGQPDNIQVQENSPLHPLPYEVHQVLPESRVNSVSIDHETSNQLNGNARGQRNYNKTDRNKPNINGIDIRFNGELLQNGVAYSRTVCEAYRHENDLIHARLRGGHNREPDLAVDSYMSLETENQSSDGSRRNKETISQYTSWNCRNLEVVSQSNNESNKSEKTGDQSKDVNERSEKFQGLNGHRRVDERRRELEGVNGHRRVDERRGELEGVNGHRREANGYIEQINGYDHNTVECAPVSSNRPIVHGLVAPLAIPESFSDDDYENSVAEDDDDLLTVFDSSNGLLNGHIVADQNQKQISTPQGNGSFSREVNCHGVRVEPDIVVSSSSESLESITSDEFGENIYTEDLDKDKKVDAANVDVQKALENLEIENRHEEGSVDPVEQVGNVVEETELDNENNDDIGDFIEADLPPNVERLAFFSRDSTSDEDEGCGDEVLLNNEDEIVSDNETIDPTDASYRSPTRPSDSNVLSSEHAVTGACNFLSGASRSVRGENVNNFYTCNISCDKSNEENDDYVFSSECDCVEETDDQQCESCNMPSHEANSSVNGDTNSANIFCACCDRPMVVDKQRQQEFGVTVCEQCSKELNAEQTRHFDNGSKHKTWPGTRSSSSNNFLNRSCGNTWFGFNNVDKVNNKCFNNVRLSSSDSDPYERMYESDFSELVSPDTEVSGELVFHLSSQEGARVQHSQQNEFIGHAGNRVLHHQSLSLDMTSPDETLYCPFYTRRSRSLDQNLLQCEDIANGDDSSLECEELIGAVGMSGEAMARSNFQDDEVNTQEKVFEKSPFNVPSTSTHNNLHMLPMPTYSSSDEEENIRMPGVSDIDLSGASGLDLDNLKVNGQVDVVPNLEMVTEGMFYGSGFKGKHSRGQKMRLEEPEPIYEDIDQLDLLLEEGSPGAVHDTDLMVRPEQPMGTAISKLRRKRRNPSPVSDIEKVMIWNEYEAYVVQVKQIGTSACGPTAVLNVLKAFDFQVEKEEVVQKIRSNLRMEAAPIPYYLFSRYNAGTTAQDLVDGVREVTRGAIRGRFFHFYPPREVNLLKWLGHWMKKGAVPVATLNLQRGVKPGWTIPDAWHHQMVYGVSSKGVYLTNPLEIVPENVILEQLTSDSVLLVRRQDVVSRFRDWCPLNDIIKQQDLRWRTMNVLGQIVHMLREQYSPADQMSPAQSPQTSHVCIPAAYKAGIILFMRANSDTIDELMNAPELPEKKSQQD